MKILHLDSSIQGEGSVSCNLSNKIVAKLRAQNPNADVTYRDLVAEPYPHLTSAGAVGRSPQAAPDTPELREELVRSQAALEEFMAADVVVIGTPMYNFGVPTQLKAWIDRLAIPGKTFTYTPQGPQGLAAGKKVIVASARGGFYKPDTPQAGFEHQESYLTAVFRLFGIPDVSFIRAEGVRAGPDGRVNAMQAADAAIAAPWPSADDPNRQTREPPMTTLTKYLPYAGRALIGVIFVLSAITKIADFSGTVREIQSVGLPLAPVGCAASILLESGCGLALISNRWVPAAAAGLALFCVATAAIFHHHFADKTQAIEFLTNLMVAGGLLQAVRAANRAPAHSHAAIGRAAAAKVA
jgi:FMN-dependent NADH-azoreductase